MARFEIKPGFGATCGTTFPSQDEMTVIIDEHLAGLCLAEQKGKAVDPIRTRINNYLCRYSPEFGSLQSLRERRINSNAYQEARRNQRQRADTADRRTQSHFFHMMQHIADEIQEETGLLICQPPKDQQSPKAVSVLDLCMAPGGYTAAARKYNPDATVTAFTLPTNMGGHAVLHKHDSSVQVKYVDITMQAAELGVHKIPRSHPERCRFSQSLLMKATDKFNLVFCDGQVLRTHQRLQYREGREGARLVCSQLVIALQHIAEGATLIMLLHRAEAWQTIDLLAKFDDFADVRLFKPRTAHRDKNSFYMIAQHVMPQHPSARQAIIHWRQQWMDATFGVHGTAEPSEPTQVKVDKFLAIFGPRLIELAENVWKTQREGIEHSPWIHKRAKERKRKRAIERTMIPENVTEKPIVLAATANETTRRLLDA